MIKAGIVTKNADTTKKTSAGTIVDTSKTVTVVREDGTIEHKVV